jgi:hypothetical protein
MAQARHQQGLELLENQQLAGALRLLGESLARKKPASDGMTGQSRNLPQDS